MASRLLTTFTALGLMACATGTGPNDSEGTALSGEGGSAAPTTGGTAGGFASEGDGPAAGGTTAGSMATGGVTSEGGSGLSGGGDGGRSGMGGASGAGLGGGGKAGSSGAAGTGGMPGAMKPSAITVATTNQATALRAPSDGGAPYTDTCPQNQVLIGFRSTIDNAHLGAGLRSVGGVCGTLSVGQSTPHAVTIAKAADLPERQTPSTGVETALCPDNQAMIGFSGRSDPYMEALSFRCAPLTIGGTAPNFTLQLGAATTSAPIGDEGAGNAFDLISCAAGDVAVAQTIKAGDAIDSFGLRCAALTLVVN